MREALEKTPQATLSGAADVALYIYPDVLEEIAFNGSWQEERLAVGLLFGTPFVRPGDTATYIEVEGFLGATHVGSVKDFSRVLRDEWKAATAEQRARFPEAQIVGWYAAGGQVAQMDAAAVVLLHNTFFNHPWQKLLRVTSGTEVPSAAHPENGVLVDDTAAVIASTKS